MTAWTDPRNPHDWSDLVEGAVAQIVARHGCTPLEARLDLIIIGLQAGNPALTDAFRRAAAALGDTDHQGGH